MLQYIFIISLIIHVAAPKMSSPLPFLVPLMCPAAVIYFPHSCFTFPLPWGQQGRTEQYSSPVDVNMTSNFQHCIRLKKKPQPSLFGPWLLCHNIWAFAFIGSLQKMIVLSRKSLHIKIRQAWE